jgi:hypothetical protein
VIQVQIVQSPSTCSMKHCSFVSFMRMKTLSNCQLHENNGAVTHAVGGTSSAILVHSLSDGFPEFVHF